MAIVKEFVPVVKDRVGRPKDTDCGFASVDVDGVTYVLLETYGSSDRAIPGKVSQSVHLNRERASELRDILEAAFSGL